MTLFSRSHFFCFLFSIYRPHYLLIISFTITYLPTDFILLYCYLFTYLPTYLLTYFTLIVSHFPPFPNSRFPNPNQVCARSVDQAFVLNDSSRRASCAGAQRHSGIPLKYFENYRLQKYFQVIGVRVVIEIFLKL